MEEISDISSNRLIEENKFLKRLIKDAPVSIHINKVDELGQNMPVWVNDKYEQLIGYSIHERQELGYINGDSGIYHEEDAQSIKDAVKYMMSDRNREESIIFRFHRKGGEQRWIYIHSKAIEYQGDPNHFISVGFDVTDKLVINEHQFDLYTKEIAQLKNKLMISQLTRIEKEIIRELAQGQSSKQIALNRGRSYDTINNHKRNIFKKLEINKLSELVAFAKDVGLD